MDEQFVSESTPPLSSLDLTVLAITLLKKVIYRDGNERLWSALFNLQTRVRGYLWLSVWSLRSMNPRVTPFCEAVPNRVTRMLVQLCRG